MHILGRALKLLSGFYHLTGTDEPTDKIDFQFKTFQMIVGFTLDLK